MLNNLTLICAHEYFTKDNFLFINNKYVFVRKIRSTMSQAFTGDRSS